MDLVVGSALFRNAFAFGGGGGHVDLPRLRAAGVDVVGLTVATRWPNLRGTLSGWHFRSLGMPASARQSNMAGAEWLIGRIERWCTESAGDLRVVRSTADLDVCLAEDGPVGILIGVQGAHVLDGDLANIAHLRQLGVRMVAPAHVMDNPAVGSGTGRSGTGLTDYGREVIATLEDQSIIVDLAHMSIAGIETTLPHLRRPFVLSHTGLTDAAGGRSRWRRYSPATRNVPASLAAEIGAAGGLVGVVLSVQLLGGSRLDDAVGTIARALDAAGEQRVAIGSDMDGALRMVLDVAGLPALTEALLASGLSESVVEGVMGSNATRLLRAAFAD